jgi:hypothetical protein
MTKKDIFRIISISFTDYLKYNPSTTGKLIKKSDIFESIFFKMGSDLEEPIEAQNMLKTLKDSVFEITSESHMNNDLSNLGAIALCLTDIISFKHGILITPKEAFQACYEVLALLHLAIAKLKEDISYKGLETSVDQK